MNYYVEVIERGSGNVEDRIGPMTKSDAERCAVGVRINLNRAEYSARVVESAAATGEAP